MRSGSLQVIEDHLVWPRGLPNYPRVIDAGANIGSFSSEMVRRFHGECVALEPVPSLFDRIPKSIRGFQSALGATLGKRQFSVSSNPLGSRFSESEVADGNQIEVSTTTIEHLLQEIGWSHADVIKLDVEGAEIEAIDAVSDEVLKSTGQITVEFHDFNHLVSIKEVQRIVDRMQSLGFVTFRRFHGCFYDTLFINRRICRINSARILAERIRLVVWGLGRRIRKLKSKG